MKKLVLLGSIALTSSLFASMGMMDKTQNLVKETTQTMQQNTKTAREMARHFLDHFQNNLPNNACSTTNHKCFNAGREMSINGHMETRIQTKKAGVAGGFQLHLRHVHHCGWGWHHHIAVALVNNITGQLITEPKEIDPTTTSDDITVNFDVKNAYKNVSVRFLHLKPIRCEFQHGFRWMHQCRHQVQNQVQNTIQNPINPKDILNKPFVLANQFSCFEVNASNFMQGGEEVPCPTNIDDIKNMVKSNIQIHTPFEGSFEYAIPKDNKCYKIDNPCDSDNPYIAQSDDNFAIVPDHFEVTLPSHISANMPASIKVVVKNASGDTITNYNNSSANLKVTFKDSHGNPIDARYAFDIVNGVGEGKVIFSKPVSNVSVSVEDEHFADVDKDDTTATDRIVTTDSSSSSSSTVSSGGSKYWAGTGTNEAENNPTKNTVNSDIKQNTKKDLHFQKMGW